MKKIRIVSTTIEIFAFLIFLIISVLTIVFMDNQSGQISSRIELSGIFGLENSMEFLLVFLAAFLLYGVLFILKRFPRLMSYPVKTDAYNIQTQANLARLMISVLALLSMSLFFLILCDMYTYAIGLPNVISPYLILGLAVAMPLTLFIYVIIAKRI